MIGPEIILWTLPRPETHVAVTCLRVRKPCHPTLPGQLPAVVRLPKPVRPKRES